jgi:LacI family transcriptional regulator
MCPSDTRQLAVLSRLRSVGLSVPDDVSVSGCDGVMPGLELLGLTTLRVPVAELARRTVALVARLVGDEPPATVVQERLPGTLLPGSTVRAVPVDDLRTPMGAPALPASSPGPGSPG